MVTSNRNVKIKYNSCASPTPYSKKTYGGRGYSLTRAQPWLKQMTGHVCLCSCQKCQTNFSIFQSVASSDDANLLFLGPKNVCFLFMKNLVACCSSLVFSNCTSNLIFVVPSIMLYSSEISPTRCNNCVFILRNALRKMNWESYRTKQS
jgi:hypothetical protein